jgi:integrase/recombinase XerD
LISDVAQMLLFLYDTGARVSEALALTPGDIQGAKLRPRRVRVRGKGNKKRCCPLWPETAIALESRHRRQQRKGNVVFRSARGRALTRDGAAYRSQSMCGSRPRKYQSVVDQRVTPACSAPQLRDRVPLIRRGVRHDPRYLGHASVATTGRYLATNVKLKRDVLSAFWRVEPVSRENRRADGADVGPVAFLSSL